jgi:hypothetical protein
LFPLVEGKQVGGGRPTQQVAVCDGGGQHVGGVGVGWTEVHCLPAAVFVNRVAQSLAYLYLFAHFLAPHVPAHVPATHSPPHARTPLSHAH